MSEAVRIGRDLTEIRTDAKVRRPPAGNQAKGRAVPRIFMFFKHFCCFLNGFLYYPQKNPSYPWGFLINFFVFLSQTSIDMTTFKKVLTWFIVIVILGLAAFCYFRFYYVFSEGVKTGELNQISRKGYVFKTYEGVMILSGYGSRNNDSKGGGVQSNEFSFSVSDAEVAEKLMSLTGQRVSLHFKEYFGTLPWRGYNKRIVDSIEESKPIEDRSHSLDEDIFTTT